MAQHGVPEELPPLVIEGNPDLRIGFSGGGGWGLSNGPRRGEGETGRYNGPGIPGFNTVIIEKHVAIITNRYLKVVRYTTSTTYAS